MLLPCALMKMFKKSMEFNKIKVALLLIVCLPCVKSFLTLSLNSSTWIEAQTHCNEKGGMLITEVQANGDDVKQLIKENNIANTQLWQGRFMTPWVWLKGCFQFDSFDRLNTNFTLKFNQMSECVKYCSETNYFGLHDKTCFCFDTLVGNSVQTDENCTITCPGNNDERCGGNVSLTVYMNDICYNNSRDWHGTISRTIHGNECLPWKDITSVAIDNNLMFPDASLDNASNYCRDPNDTAELWCYISQNQTEHCDVQKCIPNDRKQGNRKCMAAYKVSDMLHFEAKGCDESDHKAACLGVDNRVYEIQERRSWPAQRMYARKSQANGDQCKSLVDSRVFIYEKENVDISEHHWIGFVRNHTTARAADLTGKLGGCFTVSLQEADRKLDEVMSCSKRMPFICDIVPVNCGKQYGDFTDGSFRTPNFLQTYDPDMHCVWTILIPEDYLMSLQISMDIEDSPLCQYDFVKIYLGASTNDSLNATLCGKQERVFDNVDTNITIQFLSDETVQSSGISVSWTFVPNTTTTSTTDTPTLAPFTEPYQGDIKDEIKIELSVGSLAGLIVGVVLLVVLACVAGFLCGYRRRASPRKEKEERLDNGTSRVNNEAVKLPTLDNENIESEYAFSNAVFETSPTNSLSPKSGDVEKTNESPNKSVSDDPSEIIDTSALYSQVNKPRKRDDVINPKKLPVTTDTGSKQTKIPEELYNSLDEKEENMYANKTENIYNHCDDTEQNYDTATSTKVTPKKVIPDLETYDRKK